MNYLKRIFISIVAIFSIGLIYGQNSHVSTKAANVQLLEKQFAIDHIDTIARNIWLYLPPDYEKSSRKYPVIYMHDGQNLFDDQTSFAGEWHIDETLNTLYKNTGKGFIVVGIENGGEERINEYTPWKNEKYGGGKGSLYIDFIVHTLKPYIDKTYRTKSKSQFTGLIGSSLGGLISYYGGLKYPGVFGKIGALSPSFWFSDEINTFTKDHGNKNTVKIYFLLGGKEGMTKEFNQVINTLLATDFPSKNMRKKINPEGKHNESFWSIEFLEALTFLYNIK